MFKNLTFTIVNIIFLISMISPSNSYSGNKLMFIAIDGLRWDYHSQDGLDLPGFEEIFKEGVKAEYMIPEFPTNTFPNMYSAVTGLHVENHGIISNMIYDGDLGWYYYGFGVGAMKYKWYRNGEPIWATAEKQNRRSYMLDSLLCDITSPGEKATYCRSANVVSLPDPKDLRKAVDDGLDLFQRDCADVVGLYVATVDIVEHNFGPESSESKTAIQEVDTVMTYLLRQLKDTGLRDDVNVMIFSDHGMSTVPTNNIIPLQKYIHIKDVSNVVGGGAIVGIYPRKGKFEKVHNDMKKLEGDRLTVYTKNELPERWKYRNNDRVAPITLVADKSWYITTFLWNGDSNETPGGHGYDNEIEEMRAMFAAFGPNFKKEMVIPAFSIVELYQIMCDVLGIQAAPNDGTGDVSAEIVVNATTEQTADSDKPRICLPKSDVKRFTVATLSVLPMTYIMSTLGWI